MGIKKSVFSEVEIAEDIQKFISYNPQDYLNEVELKNKIMGFDKDDLLMVKKEIGSPLKIVGVEKITNKMICEAI